MERPRLHLRPIHREEPVIHDIVATGGDVAIQHAIDVRDKRPGYEKIKLGLVVAGGGNAAVASAGSLDGMTERGLNRVFAYRVGVSAGGANAAFDAAGQSDEGLEMYQSLAENGLFRYRPDEYGNYIDLRLLKRTFSRLDKKAVLLSPADVFVGVSDPNTGKGRLLDLKDSRINMTDALVATCNAPVFSRTAVVLNGDPWMDGMPDNGLPIPSAIENGCTDVIVLLNKPRSSHTGRTSLRDSFVVKASRRCPPGLQEAVLRMGANVEAQLKAAESQKTVNVTVISPESNPVGRTSRNTKLMKEVFEENKERALAMFSAMPNTTPPEREIIRIAS